jgi:hypothetical protein
MKAGGKQRPARPLLEGVSAERENKFARALGSSDYHTREAGLSALQTWLSRKAEIGAHDLLKLWKGIFYCFWHSDKAPVQVRCLSAANISACRAPRATHSNRRRPALPWRLQNLQNALAERLSEILTQLPEQASGGRDCARLQAIICPQA